MVQMPPEIWRDIFAKYMIATSTSFFDDLSERDYRKLGHLPWLQSRALTLMCVCKDWKDLAFPLLVENVCLRTQRAISAFESFIVKGSTSTQVSTGSLVQQIYIHASDTSDSSDYKSSFMRLVSIVIWMPNLHTFIDVSDSLDKSGILVRLAPVFNPCMKRISVTVKNLLSFQLLSHFRELQELHVLVGSDDDDFFADKAAPFAGFTLNKLEYLNIYVWANSDEQGDIVNQWLLPSLAECRFPALCHIRVNVKWNTKNDPRGHMKKFFKYHPNIVEINLPIWKPSDAYLLQSSIPVTSVTLHGEPMEEQIQSLPATVTRICFPLLLPDDLTCVESSLNSPLASHLRVKEVVLHRFCSKHWTPLPRFTWRKHLSYLKQIPAGSALLKRKTSAANRLATLRKALEDRRNPIKLLDSEGKTFAESRNA